MPYTPQPSPLGRAMLVVTVFAAGSALVGGVAVLAYRLGEKAEARPVAADPASSHHSTEPPARMAAAAKVPAQTAPAPPVVAKADPEPPAKMRKEVFDDLFSELRRAEKKATPDVMLRLTPNEKQLAEATMQRYLELANAYGPDESCRRRLIDMGLIEWARVKGVEIALQNENFRKILKTVSFGEPDELDPAVELEMAARWGTASFRDRQTALLAIESVNRWGSYEVPQYREAAEAVGAGFFVKAKQERDKKNKQ